MRTGGRALVESTFSLDIRLLVRAGAIRDDVHIDGEMKSPDGALAIAFEVSPATARIVGCGWMRLHGGAKGAGTAVHPDQSSADDACRGRRPGRQGYSKPNRNQARRSLLNA